MKILITGASGFLGRHLVRELLVDNHEIIVIGRSKSNLKSIFCDLPCVFETDYSLESLLNLTKDVDIVIHLASKLLSRDSHTLMISNFFANIQILENILIAAESNKVKKVIQTSSISTYNSSLDYITENMSLVPSNIYGLSKLFNDIFADYVSEKSSLKVINLRLARLFGYGEREGLVFSNYIKLAKEKKTLEIHGDGSSTIEYIYVLDVVDAIKKSIIYNNSGTFNIGTGKLFSIKNIAEAVNKVFDNNGNIRFVESNRNSIQGTLMSSEKAKKMLDWKPIWELETAIKDILKYSLKEKNHE